MLATALATPPNSSNRGAPMLTSKTLKALLTLPNESSRLPVILPKATPTDPALLPMLTTASLNLSACGPVSTSAAVRPPTSPIRRDIFSVLPPVALAISSSTKARPLVLRVLASKLMPSSAASSDASLLGLMMLLMVLRKYSIACPGLMPLAVSVAMAAPTSSRLTPLAAATGVTMARLCARSVISILPSLMI